MTTDLTINLGGLPEERPEQGGGSSSGLPQELFERLRNIEQQLRDVRAQVERVRPEAGEPPAAAVSPRRAGRPRKEVPEGVREIPDPFPGKSTAELTPEQRAERRRIQKLNTAAWARARRRARAQQPVPPAEAVTSGAGEIPAEQVEIPEPAGPEAPTAPVEPASRQAAEEIIRQAAQGGPLPFEDEEAEERRQEEEDQLSVLILTLRNLILIARDTGTVSFRTARLLQLLLQYIPRSQLQPVEAALRRTGAVLPFFRRVGGAGVRAATGLARSLLAMTGFRREGEPPAATPSGPEPSPVTPQPSPQPAARTEEQPSAVTQTVQQIVSEAAQQAIQRGLSGQVAGQAPPPSRPPTAATARGGVSPAAGGAGTVGASTGAAGAGAAGAAAGAGGAAAVAAGAGGAGGGGGAAGAGAAAAGGITVAGAAAAIAALVGATVALIGAMKLLEASAKLVASQLEGLAEHVADFSPQVIQAQVNLELQRLENRMRMATRLGTATAANLELQRQISEIWNEFKTVAIVPALKTLEAILVLIKALLELLGPVLYILAFLLILIAGLVKIVVKILDILTHITGVRYVFNLLRRFLEKSLFGDEEVAPEIVEEIKAFFGIGRDKPKEK